MSAPLVSVIIPTYNRFDFLKQAVDSVQAQSYQDFELIIVDDCSDDETEKEYGNRSDIRYIKLNTRSYPSGARNRGVEQSNGQYIAFLDSDDLWHRNKLEKQMDFMKDHPNVRICHTDEQWIRNGIKVNQKEKHRKGGGFIFKNCLQRCLISPSAVLMERSLFSEYKGFDESIEVGEDYELWLRITANEEIGFIREKLTVKRGGHDDQLSRKYGQIEVFRIKGIENALKSGLLNEEQKTNARDALREKCLVYANGCIKRGRKEEAREYLKKADAFSM
jgi:glycosyltransferase involved in cell wall biosynthesis